MMYKYLTVEEVILIHDRLIGIGGGKLGILDYQNLDSAVNRSRATFSGKKLYDSIFDEAAALIQSIIKNHPFVDGNKRTGFFSGLRFLNQNGYELQFKNVEIVDYVVKIDTKNYSIKQIGNWLNQHKI